jgi:hypothetical protein
VQVLGGHQSEVSIYSVSVIRKKKRKEKKEKGIEKNKACGMVRLPH